MTSIMQVHTRQLRYHAHYAMPLEIENPRYVCKKEELKIIHHTSNASNTDRTSKKSPTMPLSNKLLLVT
jgi:hypothetical protein